MSTLDIIFISIYAVLGVLFVYFGVQFVYYGVLVIRDRIQERRRKRALEDEFEGAGFQSGSRRLAIETDRFYR